MKFGLISLMKMISFLSTSIIVHEEKFKEILKSEYNCPAQKVRIIPHGIEATNDLIGKDQAKEILGLSGRKIVLFFGYITGYKNVELLVESSSFLKTSDLFIVIAGGPHPRLKDDPSYQRYLSGLQKKAFMISKDRFLFRGFVPENEVSLYFSAADLVVFPYKVVMSSSGPFQLSVSYKKPILVSDSFKDIVRVEELIFEGHPESLAAKIEAFFEKPEWEFKALKYVERLSAERSWVNIANETIRLYKGIVK
jgi:glycosyltransferase involved in cell wall biosynthesis